MAHRDKALVTVICASGRVSWYRVHLLGDFKQKSQMLNVRVMIMITLALI